MEKKSSKVNSWWDNLTSGRKVGIVVIVAIILVIVGGGLYKTGSLDGYIDRNYNPEIVYTYPGTPVYTNQLYPGSSNDKINELRAGIIDRDGDNLQVTFWMSNNSSPWKGLALFQGNNGTYMCHLDRNYTISELRNNNYQWKIDVSDGKATTSKICDMWNV